MLEFGYPVHRFQGNWLANFTLYGQGEHCSYCVKQVALFCHVFDYRTLPSARRRRAWKKDGMIWLNASLMMLNWKPSLACLTFVVIGRPTQSSVHQHVKEKEHPWFSYSRENSRELERTQKDISAR
jgi:hypothetical protein